MQWSHEGKKLDCAVKHLAWRPPWVKPSEVGEPDPAAPFVKPEHMVEDTVGLNRIPVSWFTLNCKYNTAYDIHRLNVGSQFARAAVESVRDEHQQVRFDFVRDAPDIATFMVALRTELHMRIVMPAIVPHTEQHRFLAMARFEVGESHPHYHGFTMGSGNPRLQRVRADVGDGGKGDEASGSDMGEVDGSNDMPEDDRETCAGDRDREGATGDEGMEGAGQAEVPAAPSRYAQDEDVVSEVPVASVGSVGSAGRGGRGGRRRSSGRRELSRQTTMRRLPDTLNPRNAGVQSQEAMEAEF